LVTLNVMHRTYAQLLWPLDYAQAAPPLFLWIERWIYLHWGFGEDQLRLVSLLCGAASVGLFAWVVWRRFPAPIAVAAAAIFAFCDKLIWHSDEVKQYSSDVFSALILIALAIGLRRPVSSLRRLWLIALVSAVLLWFSFPVVFVYRTDQLDAAGHDCPACCMGTNITCQCDILVPGCKCSCDGIVYSAVSNHRQRPCTIPRSLLAGAFRRLVALVDYSLVADIRSF